MKKQKKKTKTDALKEKDMIQKYVLIFFNKKQRFKKQEEEQDVVKREFYKTMDDYFDKHGLDEICFDYDVLSDEEGCKTLKVKRVQNTKVIFDVEKLEKRVSKDIRKEIIKKDITIFDLDGLIKYLKTCGVNPKIFKSFLNVNKIVDVDEIERLSEIGLITDEDIKGCFEVKRNKPYYKINPIKKEEE